MKIDYQHRIFGLDLMRAIAILFVVFSHALWIFPEAEGVLVAVLKLAGIMGVEIFFVLSGFLIGRILFKTYTHPDFKLKNFRYFLIRRWFRTLPNYYLVLLINIAIVLYIGRDLPDMLSSYFLFFQNALSKMAIFFTESWSLSVEEFAYIVGPMFLILLAILPIRFSKKSKFLMGTLLVILLFTITKIYYNQHHQGVDMDYWNNNLKSVVLYRIDAIYYGVLAAYISLVYPKLWQAKPVFLCLLGFLLFNVFHFIAIYKQLTISSFSWLWNVVYLPFCSVCIALSLPWFSGLRTVFPVFLKPITYISIISYSMYLLHYSIILQLMRYFFRIENYTFSQKLIYALIYLILTLLFSYFLYRFYEKPMTDIRDKSFFAKKHPKV